MEEKHKQKDFIIEGAMESNGNRLVTTERIDAPLDRGNQAKIVFRFLLDNLPWGTYEKLLVLMIRDGLFESDGAEKETIEAIKKLIGRYIATHL